MSQANPARRPSIALVPVRILLVTFLLTLLSAAMSLLLGIVGILISAKLRGSVPNMTLAYRYIALPIAMAVASITLVSATVLEVRTYRQNKALSEIERAA